MGGVNAVRGAVRLRKAVRESIMYMSTEAGRCAAELSGTAGRVKAAMEGGTGGKEVMLLLLLML